MSTVRPDSTGSGDAQPDPILQAIAKTMEQYGRLDLNAFRAMSADSESSLTSLLKHALKIMGCCFDYEQAMTEYRRGIKPEAVTEIDLLAAAVESCYYASPEALKYQAHESAIPEWYEELKLSFTPPGFRFLRDKLTDWQYLACRTGARVWQIGPVPAKIDLAQAAELELLCTTFQQLLEDNSKPNRFGELEYHPIVQLHGNAKSGVFEIYIDRKGVVRVPVPEFIRRQNVRRDVRSADEHNEVFKALVVKDFEDKQHNRADNFPQRHAAVALLEDLLLNTPLEDDLSYGHQAIWAALIRRIEEKRNPRVPGPLR